jgi:photosystem II stability/assembly factor-like uncharacterized protein
MREPTRGLLFAGAHGSGLFRSSDDGASWAEAEAGLQSRHIFTLAYAIEGDGVALYAGTEPAMLYRSRDYGENWLELSGLRDVPSQPGWNFPAPPHIAHVKHVAADPRDSDTLYVCVEQGALLKSIDDGQTFVDVAFQDESYRLNRDTHRVVFTPSDPDHIFLTGGDGIATSLDAGRSWSRLSTHEMRLSYPDQLFISPDDEQVMFAVGAGVPPNIWRETGSAIATVMRSDDRGHSWSEIGGGLPDILHGNIEAATLVSWPGGFGLFLGTTDGEIFASMDDGQRWRVIRDGLPPVSKCIHRRNLDIGRAAAAGR